MRTKRIPLVIASAVFIALAFTGCFIFVQYGNCFASLNWSSSYYLTVNSDFASTSGFGRDPRSMSSGIYYSISPFSHYFDFVLSPYGYQTYTSFRCSYNLDPHEGYLGDDILDAYYRIQLYDSGSSVIDQPKSLSASAEPVFKVGDQVVPLDKEVTVSTKGYDMKIKISKVNLSQDEIKTFIPVGK